MNQLTFATLREANTQRLPQFKNKHGQPAHSTTDGSDWSPAQWFRAFVGEVGQLAEVRIELEAGRITFEQYKIKAEKELADIQTYLDLLAKRILDVVYDYPFDDSSAQTFMRMVSIVGTYGNEAKKYDRGDIDEVAINRHTKNLVHALAGSVYELGVSCTIKNHCGDEVIEAHPTGVDLGQATVDKFNEVSRRVGSTVFLDNSGTVILASDENDRQRLNYNTDPSSIHPCYD
jgi:hypothetical protein